MWKPDPSQIVTPEIIREEKRATMRALRNRLLDESDWSQMPDAPNADKALWRTYRQALRDLDMDIPVWPEKPPRSAGSPFVLDARPSTKGNIEHDQ